MRSCAVATKAFVLFLFSLIALSDAALACRGYRFWSTGEDMAKLKPGEIVVKAKLLGTYRSEQRFESIMGMPYGMIYHIQLNDLIGGADGDGLHAGSNILVRLPPSICEVYVPRDFSKDSDKTLVLKKMPDGIYDLVGGRE
jgi:hypothetical protein